MSRSLLEDGREVPSVIKKIVIYDKPNKPYVSYDIFSQRNFDRSYPSGDIVLSQSKNEVLKQELPFDSKLENEIEIKSEPDDDDDGELEKEEQQQNPEEPTEIGEETVNENTSDIEESIENISKEVSKIEQKQAPKRVKETVERPLILRTYSRKKAQVAEKPQPKKATEGQPQQQSKPSTILNFLIKPLEQKVSLETNSGSSTDVEDAPETPQSKNTYTREEKSNENTSGKYSVSEGRQKRTRRIPKKYQDNILLDNLNEALNGDDDALPASKKKKYTELKAVPYPGLEDGDESSNSDNLEGLLNDVEQQVKTTKLQKLAEKTKNRTDHEASDEEQQTIKLEDIDDELGDKIQEDDDESDDSRQEWLPDEYVEYKRQHVLNKTAQVHKCKFCHKTFKSYYAMRKHRALDHDDLGKDTKESTFQPVGTEEEESDEESRSEWLPADYAEYKLKHKEKRAQWYKCKICCSVFSTYYKLTKHRLDHEKQSNPYDCKQCDAKFNDVETFTAHIRNHQGKDPYSCKKCDKGFLSKHDLIKHAEVHVLKKPPAVEKRYRCDVCSKEFHKLCDIERHTRVHTGEKPSQCTICQKRFQQPYNLSKHLLTHLHVKPFQCEICNKKFGRIDVLNRHLLTHSIEKPFKCIICGKGFIRQVQLNNHMGKSHPGLNNVTSIDEVSISPVV